MYACGTTWRAEVEEEARGTVLRGGESKVNTQGKSKFMVVVVVWCVLSGLTLNRFNSRIFISS